MFEPLEIVAGTRNRKKRAEIADCLRGLPVRLTSLDEYPQSVEVEETADTFAGNAALKASTQAIAIQRWVLGEDSGLNVEALNGQPGVWSARFAGPGATDETNNAKLMELMRAVPPGQRRARYTCHACLANPSGEVVFCCEGRCYGQIVVEPRGVAGFGYDPYFEIPEYGLTFAELGLAVKSLISHRARALRQLRDFVQRLERKGASPPAPAPLDSPVQR
jgi:XTP/dITP diphosphohydrolase